MKKIISLILVFMFVLSLTACSLGKGPDSVVEDYCKALKEFNLEKVADYMGGDAFDMMNMPEGSAEKVLMTFFKEQSKNIKYSIGEPEEDGNVATVKVDFKYNDASSLYSAVLGEYLLQGMALGLSGADDSVIENLFPTIFKEKREKALLVADNVSIVFYCEKIDGDWKILGLSDDSIDKIVNMMTCNFMEVFNSFDSSSSNNTNQVSKPNELVWNDVPMGNRVRLASLEMKVVDCSMVDKLTAEGVNDYDAGKGSKFLVVEFEVKNVTRDPIDYNHELILRDNNGNIYPVFEMGSCYFEESLRYITLSPSVPVVGYIVYNVPEDCTSFYYEVSKAGTNEAYRLLINN